MFTLDELDLLIEACTELEFSHYNALKHRKDRVTRAYLKGQLHLIENSLQKLHSMRMNETSTLQIGKDLESGS